MQTDWFFSAVRVFSYFCLRSRKLERCVWKRSTIIKLIWKREENITKLFTGLWFPRAVKNCDLELENPTCGLRPRAVFLNIGHCFPLYGPSMAHPVNNIFIFMALAANGLRSYFVSFFLKPYHYSKNNWRCFGIFLNLYHLILWNMKRFIASNFRKKESWNRQNSTVKPVDLRGWCSWVHSTTFWDTFLVESFSGVNILYLVYTVER